MDYRKKIEELLGRELKNTEIIHHIDGNPRNNKINNIKIIDISHDKSAHIKEKHPTKEEHFQRVIELLNNNIDFQGDVFYNDMKKIFTDRQIEIILRKFFNLELSKTEKELFSRTIKKRLIAFQNTNISKLSYFVCKKGSY